MMNLLIEKSNLSNYLQADREVDWGDSSIRGKAETLFSKSDDEVDTVRIAFDFVCNSVAHSADIHSRRMTRTASEVLQYGEGICYAKSMLLAALLRSRGIPTGFCYQTLRLTDFPDSPLVIHALNAVYLAGHREWTRLDARGNTNGIHAQFIPGEEHLAFPVRPDLGESDDPIIYAAPHPTVVAVLHRFTDCQEMFRHLPDSLFE